MTRGNRIKDMMYQRNVSVKELASACEKSVQYVYDLLKDKADNPSVNVLNGIAKKLGVSIDYLENGTTDKILYAEPEIYNRLPDDLQEFVLNQENIPYISYAKQMKRFDIDELLKNIDNEDMKFLLAGLKMYIERHKKSE